MISKEKIIIDKNANEDILSATAVWVIMAFMRSMELGAEHLFGSNELELVKHLYKTGKRELPYGINSALISGTVALPNFLVQSLYKKEERPAYFDLIMLRKLMILNTIKQAIQEGIKQVVFLGGGFDVRAFFAALENPEVHFFELDRGKTRKTKMIGLQSFLENKAEYDYEWDLEDNILTVGKNLHYIGCDLAQDNVLETLLANHFQYGEKNLIIAEGLTMYLGEAQVIRLLELINLLIHDGDQLLVSFIDKMDASSQVLNAALRESEETYHFSLPTTEVIPFVGKYGFDTKGKFVASSLLEEVGKNEAAIFYANSKRDQEYYYLLEKSSSIDLSKTMEEVLPIACPIAKKPNHQEEKSGCLVM